MCSDPSGMPVFQRRFFGCTNLTSVSLPSGLTTVYADAFQGCANLTSVTIPASVKLIDDASFAFCLNLQSMYFQGGAPHIIGSAFEAFSPTTLYYLPGTSGWAPIVAERPTAVWVAPAPMVLPMTSNIGVGDLGFTVSWATNKSVVVEASTDLNNAVWLPVTTNALVNGTADFSVPIQRGLPGQYFRVRSF
jgi:hypothetical protein